MGLFKNIKLVAPSIKGNILDYGCGSKPYEHLFKHAKSYIGVDINMSGHDHWDSKVDCYFDGANLPFKNKGFDAIVSFEVFEHVFNLPEILMELNRVLDDDGILAITIPFAWEEHEIPYDYARYTMYGMISELKKAGFQMVSTKKTTTYIMAISQLLILYILKNLSPKNRILKKVIQLIVIFPITLTTLILNKILPEKYDYYLNCLYIAKKGPKIT